MVCWACGGAGRAPRRTVLGRLGGERHLGWGWRLALVLRHGFAAGLLGGGTVRRLGQLHELAALLRRHRGEAVLVAQPLDLGLTLIARQARGLLDELRDDTIAPALPARLLGTQRFAVFLGLADRVGDLGRQLLDQDLIEQVLDFSLPRHATVAVTREAQRVVAGL